jgi:hypothetical protein
MPRADRVQFDQVRDDLERHYEATGERDLAEYRRRVKHLKRLPMPKKPKEGAPRKGSSSATNTTPCAST